MVAARGAPAWVRAIVEAGYYTSMAGNLAEENVRNNPEDSLLKTFNRAAMGVGIEMAIEKISGSSATKIYSWFDDAAKAGLKTTATGKFSKVANFFKATAAGKVIKGFAGEGFEEGLAEVVNTIVNTAVFKDEWNENLVEDAFKAALIGGLVGGILEGFAVATTNKHVLDAYLKDGQKLSKAQVMAFQEAIANHSEALKDAFGINGTISALDSLAKKEGFADRHELMRAASNDPEMSKKLSQNEDVKRLVNIYSEYAALVEFCGGTDKFIDLWKLNHEATVDQLKALNLIAWSMEAPLTGRIAVAWKKINSKDPSLNIVPVDVAVSMSNGEIIPDAPKLIEYKQTFEKATGLSLV